ncbi:Catalyzes the ferrous insertion into protoporphyrin IX [Teratosphaeria destructans]|uniref:Catalyzes the ferrous insertion into protoporphyrin IX n=1 Tax=Teratosphaeria destructans TaxID=418781 RepID=A0A9W7W470_9PEZI|nr:Catalyzes the ferrous insertion into protoporphyrin IX [Teratosphaeria destructans]
MSVFRKLRRSSKDVMSQVSSGRHVSTATTKDSTQNGEEAPKTTFFDLPAELRNVVYELVASDTVMTLPRSRKESSKFPVPVPGLLLTSRQCRMEYRTLFFSTVPVNVEVKDFDFRNLIRIVGSLYGTELRALRENRNLTIRLRTQNCAKEHVNLLRKWLGNRAYSLDRLPWQYEVGHPPINSKMHCFRLSRELAFYCERLAGLQARLEETLQWELQAILAAFERKVTELDDVLQGVRPALRDPSALRGLSGGGVH